MGCAIVNLASWLLHILLWLIHHLLLLLLDNLEHVPEVGLINSHPECLRIHLEQALVLQEVLARIEVEAFTRQHLQESFFLVGEVFWDLRMTGRASGSHRELVLHHASLVFCSSLGQDIVPSHKVKKLTGQFLKDLFREKVGVVSEVVEWHELNDIRSHILTISLRVKCFLICVELVHGLEISITDTDNNHCGW